MRSRPLPIAAAALFVVLLAWIPRNDAAASPLTYLSQTGGIGASAGHPRLEDSGESLPIPGVSDFDETVLVAASVPPDGYEARAELATSLGATELSLYGFTSASVEGCSHFEQEEGMCGASSSAEAKIVFDLSVPALTQMQYSMDGSAHNGPWLRLSHATLGFVMTSNYIGEWWMEECGSLALDECYALIDVFLDGAVLPAGEYELVFDLFAWIPLGSCAVGCHDAGGGFLMSVVPEPASGFLLGLGLAALGLGRRRRTARRFERCEL